MIEYKVKVFDDGDKVWHLNNKLHREDGPAIEYADGYKAWYLNGMRHRENGPAIEFADGTKEWYLNGLCLAGETFNRRTQVKEMTIADIEEKLGYTIKVVK